MKYQQGQDREQLHIFPVTMEASISAENEVRMIELFVEELDMEALGFKLNQIENGRPAYHPKDLLKLYLYGYMNRVRSSRELEYALSQSCWISLFTPEPVLSMPKQRKLGLVKHIKK